MFALVSLYLQLSPMLPHCYLLFHLVTVLHLVTVFEFVLEPWGVFKPRFCFLLYMLPWFSSWKLSEKFQSNVPSRCFPTACFRIRRLGVEFLGVWSGTKLFDTWRNFPQRFISIILSWNIQQTIITSDDGFGGSVGFKQMLAQARLGTDAEVISATERPSDAGKDLTQAPQINEVRNNSHNRPVFLLSSG